MPYYINEINESFCKYQNCMSLRVKKNSKSSENLGLGPVPGVADLISGKQQTGNTGLVGHPKSADTPYEIH